VLQESAVQALSSLQFRVACAQPVVFPQESTVHALLSSHETSEYTQPSVALQDADTHMPRSAQATGTWTQPVLLLQLSVVQALSSSLINQLVLKYFDNKGGRTNSMECVRHQ
jgi:hypothetical protein